MRNNLRSHPTPTGRRRTGPRGGLRAAAALVMGAIVLLGGCGTDDGIDTATSPKPSPTRAPSPKTSPTEPSSTSPAAPASPSSTPVTRPVVSGVYFMVDTRAGLRLSRELRDLTAADPAKEAVETMIAGPSDPDYASPWNKATKVLGVTRNGNTITVNLSREARRADVGSQGAALMVQQLVYTVTEAVDKNDDVRLLVGGTSPGDLWGTVRWDEPIGRQDPLDVRCFVQIDSPRQGATTSSPLVVKGDAAAYEATVPWRILDANGKPVRTGATTSAEGMTFSPYSFKVRLKPGTYTVEVVEDDPSGGEGGKPMSDTRTVTIQ